MLDQLLPHADPTVEANATPSILDVVEKVQLNMDDDDDEEEEEREGSQQVSVSEMSGTQPTEESRPGSAGPAGSGWRAGGAPLSELDSEEVSCSQQGASELSAPGLLEGTESTDDLGDASLKGAVDIEGMSASAGSPDFEKVPDIPSNDFEDEDDRVCDMEVGSEWTEDPRRVSPDDEEEDEDVEMASEGVTESGLESYGNPDEDDFPEDERLDNLNRVQQCLPLPSAQVPQWDPTPHNYSSDPWTQQPAPASPLDPANVAACGQTMSDSGGLTLQAVHSSCVPQTYEELHVYNASSGVESRSELGERQSLENVNRAPPAPPLPSAQGTQWDRPNLNSACDPGALAAPTSPSTVQQRSDSEALAQSTSPASVYPQEKDALHPKAQSSIASAVYSSSDTSTSDELQDYNSSSGVGSLSNMSKLHSPTSAVHTHALDDQDRSVPLETSDGAETPPADDNPRGPTVACVSDSSSSSTTEDEASDMEGEAQLDEPVEDQGIDNAAFIGNRPAAQRSLSALEEGEETCMVVGEGGLETPHSADSVASYAFDMTASNSNSHSTADGCPKSPGIFSLEELPKEDKDQSVIQELTLPSPQLQPGSAEPLVSSSGEQHYMHCGDVDAELGDRNDVKPWTQCCLWPPSTRGGAPVTPSHPITQLSVITLRTLRQVTYSPPLHT
ncbi:hypothetical protein DPEC_G00369940 [Dallia pectoralis]|nr:hypothetical protein DPEC_G00369940 [Dallia pectoralis]